MLLESEKNVPKWGECYYDHFEKYLGKPINREIFEQNRINPVIQIISYDNVFSNCRAFCSFGLSHYASQISEVAEVFMPVDAGWEDTPLILAGTLFYIIQHDISIGRGRAIRFADVFPDFALKFGKAAIYFADPFGVPEDFKRVRCGSKVGEIYLACYISDAEYHFKVENGTDKFEALLEEKNVDVFHVQRDSCI